MNRMLAPRLKVIAVLHRFSWLPPLITRLVIGFVFVQSGWGKLHNLPKVIEFFQTLGIPAPAIQAPFVAGMEFVCGVLCLIGFFTRLISLPLIAIMVVAILTAKLEDLHEFSDLFSISEFLYIVLLVWLIEFGPGKVSVDHLLLAKAQPKAS